MIYTQKYTTKIDLNNKSHNNRKPQMNICDLRVNVSNSLIFVKTKFKA